MRRPLLLGISAVLLVTLIAPPAEADAPVSSTAFASALAAAPYLPDDDRTPGAVFGRIVVNYLLDLADRFDAQGQPRPAALVARLAARFECALFGCPPEPGDVRPAMDLTLAGGFFSFPWPGDTRRRPDGTIDLSGFPGRDVSPVLNTIIGSTEAATPGFGTNSSVYFQVPGPVDETALPTADQSVRRRSGSMLLDLDDPAAAPVPLLIDHHRPGTALRPPDLLSLLPYPGHPLTPGHRYGAVLFDGLLTNDGRALSPAPLLDALDGPAPAGTDADTWTTLQHDRQLVFDAVRGRTLWHQSDVVAFSVFTTQPIGVELDAIKDAIDALAPPVPISRTVGGCASGARQTISTGQLDLPKWQQGVSPYLLGGGAIVVGSDGRAIQQGTERVLFEMSVPCAPAPDQGWPVLLYIGGTGGSANVRRIASLGIDVANPAAPTLPYVIISIAPLFSGDRTEPGAPPELLFFNYLNPLAGRTNQLQQAADVVYLSRVARGLELAASESVDGGPVTINDDLVATAGHSQGALTLPITLAADPSLDAGFLSAGGAGLYHSLVHRGDVRTLVDALLPTQPGEIDQFHPVVHVLQTLVEVGDAANYAAAVDSPELALYVGLTDGCSPYEVGVHLASALGVDIANPATAGPVFGSSAFEPSVVALPASGNLADGRTGVAVTVDAGHFGASTNPAIGRSFLRSLASGGEAVVDPGPLVTEPPPTQSCVRADPPPGP